MKLLRSIALFILNLATALTLIAANAAPQVSTQNTVMHYFLRQMKIQAARHKSLKLRVSTLSLKPCRPPLWDGASSIHPPGRKTLRMKCSPVIMMA